jgi:hypothetical protein
VYCGSCSGPGIPFIGVWCPDADCGGSGISIGEIVSTSSDEVGDVDTEQEDDTEIETASLSKQSSKKDDQWKIMLDLLCDKIQGQIEEEWDDDLEKGYSDSEAARIIIDMLDDCEEKPPERVIKVLTKYAYLRFFIDGWNAKIEERKRRLEE